MALSYCEEAFLIMKERRGGYTISQGRHLWNKKLEIK